MIFINLLRTLWPAIILILLIPIVKDDFILAAIFAVVTIIYIVTHNQRNDWLIYTFAVFGMTAFESLFIMTGVETFSTKTLLGIMPIWLPLLWGFAFVLVRRAIKVVENFKH